METQILRSEFSAARASSSRSALARRGAHPRASNRRAGPRSAIRASPRASRNGTACAARPIWSSRCKPRSRSSKTSTEDPGTSEYRYLPDRYADVLRRQRRAARANGRSHQALGDIECARSHRPPLRAGSAALPFRLPRARLAGTSVPLAGPPAAISAIVSVDSSRLKQCPGPRQYALSGRVHQLPCSDCSRFLRRLVTQRR